jgi:hypothetical protein
MISETPISAKVISENINRLRKEASAKEDELNSLRAELEWWETGQQLFGEAPEEPTDRLPLETSEETTATNGAKPSLRTRILLILSQEPRKTWKTEDVIAEMGKRDWLPGGEYAEHHVRSMLGQMHRKGQARRMGRGMYRLPPKPKDGMSTAEIAGNVAAGVGVGALAAHAISSLAGAAKG